MLRYKLGGFPELSPENAQKLSQEVSAKVARGEDPRAERRKERAGDTLGELFQRYMTLESKPHKRTWRQDEKIFNRYAKPLKSRKVGTITKEDVRGLHVRAGNSRTVRLEQ